jgi:hypothetical protein
MRLAARLAVTALTLVGTGCITNYYQHPGTGYHVSTGADTGPRGDLTWVQPAIIEHILLQTETGLLTYYEVAQFAGLKQDVSVFMRQVYTEAAADVRAVEASDAYAQVQREPAPQSMPQSARGLALARAAARIIAPHAARSLQEKSYARISWGRKLDGGGMGMGPHFLYLTAHKNEKVVKVIAADINATFARLKETKFDVSGVPGAFDPGASVDLATARAKVRRQ